MHYVTSSALDDNLGVVKRALRGLARELHMSLDSKIYRHINARTAVSRISSHLDTIP